MRESLTGRPRFELPDLGSGGIDCDIDWSVMSWNALATRAFAGDGWFVSWDDSSKHLVQVEKIWTGTCGSGCGRLEETG